MSHQPGALTSVNVGTTRSYQYEDRRVRSAFLKAPVTGSLMVGALGLEGDRQADLRVHGGPNKALLCYAALHYPLWLQETGLPMRPGGFGENLTVDGQDETTVCIGDVMKIGTAIVAITTPREPCFKIGMVWEYPSLVERVLQTGRHGWYLRVIEAGAVAAGDTIALQERPHPRWTVRRAADTYLAPTKDLGETLELASLAGYPEKHSRRLAAIVARQ